MWSPQQYAMPPRLTPQELVPPALRPANVSPPETATGTAASSVEPLPSWPHTLKPQQYAAPFVVRPQVWYRQPASTAENASPPLTAAGTKLKPFEPFPSSPCPPSPQQYAVPLVLTPQLCSRPGPTLEKVRSPVTATGTDLGVTDPSPSGPKPL